MSANDCQLCGHEAVVNIDTALQAGMPVPDVARRFSISSLAVYRHKAHTADLVPVTNATKREAANVSPIGENRPATEEQAPKVAPVRAKLFADMPAKQYLHLWTMQPHAIARKLTPGERCRPDYNPAHPFSSSLPPEALSSRDVPAWGTGDGFRKLEKLRDEGY